MLFLKCCSYDHLSLIISSKISPDGDSSTAKLIPQEVPAAPAQPTEFQTNSASPNTSTNFKIITSHLSRTTTHTGLIVISRVSSIQVSSTIPPTPIAALKTLLSKSTRFLRI
uniref:Uncharacterized protein n=1 Tax=Rhodosorus marinus TaxID=101924 RepID=A0A6T6P8N3_9RHOD